MGHVRVIGSVGVLLTRRWGRQSCREEGRAWSNPTPHQRFLHLFCVYSQVSPSLFETGSPGAQASLVAHYLAQDDYKCLILLPLPLPHECHTRVWNPEQALHHYILSPLKLRMRSN